MLNLIFFPCVSGSLGHSLLLHLFLASSPTIHLYSIFIQNVRWLTTEIFSMEPLKIEINQNDKVHQTQNAHTLTFKHLIPDI